MIEEKVKVRRAAMEDVRPWLELAREVETLFGPMAEEPAFQQALRDAVTSGSAFCTDGSQDAGAPILQGGIVISTEANEIVWLAVSGNSRGRGMGRALVAFALDRLSADKPVIVQTFADSVPEGVAARRLYAAFGFADHQEAGPNPAGIPTVLMKRPATAEAE